MSSPARLFAPRALSLSLLSLSLLALAPAAWAVEPLDTFSFRAGGYISTFDSEVRADGEVSNGTPIELDRDLDLDQDNAIAFLSATWRPFDRHEFGLAYYQDDVSATRQLQRDIVFDDTVYPASGTVRSDFDVSAYEASYVWWAASHERWAMGPRLGLVWYDIELSIALELDVDGNQTDGSISDSVSADLPAPSIGGSWRWTPADQWRVSADAGYFAADVGDIDADVLFARGAVEWYPWERVGFWIDYTISDIDAEIDDSRLDGDFNFRDSGVRLGVAYRF